jgi:hypothetical protein
MREADETPIGPCISGRAADPAALLRRVQFKLRHRWTESYLTRGADDPETQTAEGASAVIEDLLIALEPQPAVSNAPGAGLYLQPGEKKHPYWWDRI